MSKSLIAILFIILLLTSIIWYYLPILHAIKIEKSVPLPTLEKLTLGAELSLLSAPIWVAERQGYFRQEGLDLNIIEFESGKASFIAMLNQQTVDLSTVAPTPIMFNSFKRRDFSIVATFVHSDDDIKVIARKDKGINRAKDLLGKKIGTPAGTTGQFFVDSLLTFYDIPISKVEVLDIRPIKLAGALQSGLVDAIVIWEPHAYDVQHLMPNKALRIPSKGIYLETFNFMAMNSFIKTRPESIKKFLLAINKAITFIKQNKAQAQNIVATRLALDNDVIRLLWQDFEYELSLNQELIMTLEMEARWAIREKLTNGTEVPNYFNYIYLQALAQVNPKAVSIFH